MAEQQPERPPMHPDREQLFGNEAFAIGMLQVVSGGSVVAAISQLDKILQLTGKGSFLSFITLMSFSLVAAVLAAYWRHQYKMWDVKLHSTEANRDLSRMRKSMLVSVILVVVGVLSLVGAFWYAAYCRPSAL
jgi:uncharacterized membrane protein YiaA